ncbi:MAG: hypothetical protein JXA21_16665 [Anaerolineae bacterium]|nr:hypothetical protein [Anaerolineae bacterium]
MDNFYMNFLTKVGAVIVAIAMFVLAVLIKWALLRRWVDKKRAFTDALVMNLGSTIFGKLVTPQTLMLLIAAMTEWLAERLVPNMDPAAWNSPINFFGLGTLSVMMAGIMAFLIEGITLTALEPRQTPLRKIWGTTLIANIAYGVITIVAYIGWHMIVMSFYR